MILKILLIITLILQLLGISGWAGALDNYLLGKYFKETPEIDILRDYKPSFAPNKTQDMIAPDIAATASMVLDIDSASVLYEKNADQKLAPASLTKLLTALVVIDKANLEDVVTVPKEATEQEEYKIGLEDGDRVKVKFLLEAMIINSANDAAITLARYIEPSNKKFSEIMNQRARDLGLLNTNFTNPVGYDEPKHFSTARDLAFLMKWVLKDEFLVSIMQKSQDTFYSEDGKIYNIKTTDELLNSYLNIVGGKTGFTDEAGESVIMVAKNNQGNEIIAVLLHSPERFNEAKKLIDWTFRAYNRD